MNNYHIYSEIGRGKGSVVYKGREKKTIHYVAIKSVEKQYKKKVLNEVSVLYSLVHPNILRFLNWYETSKHIWLILDFCVGGDLLAMLRLDQAMPEATCKRFAADILSGLQVVHAAGYIYADLKPSNVLVNEEGTLMLADFGLARKVRQDEENQPEETNKRGSPYYMAPELFYSDGIHSYASDLFAFGCLMYELATGRPPFYSASLEEVVTQILEQDPHPLPEADPNAPPTPTDNGVPPQPPHRFTRPFQHMLSRCLEKDPAQRMTWSELRQHPWWTGSPVQLETLELPEQPVFDRLFMGGAAPGQPTNMRASAQLQKPPDVMRLSFQAKKNRIAEVDAARAAAVTADSLTASVPVPAPAAIPEADEIEENLDGTVAHLTLPNYDTELDFSSGGGATENSRPSHSRAASQSQSRPATNATFREPPRPHKPSELDEMEAQLARLKAREEDEDDDGEDGEDVEEDLGDEDIAEEEVEETWPQSDAQATREFRTHTGGASRASDVYDDEDNYDDAMALNPRSSPPSYAGYDDEQPPPSSSTSFGAARPRRDTAPSTPSTSSHRPSPASSKPSTPSRKPVSSSSRLPVLAPRTTATTSSSTVAASRKSTTSKPTSSSTSTSGSGSATSSARTSASRKPDAPSSSSSSSRQPTATSSRRT